MVEEVFKKNKEKKWLSCLKCGKPIFTDRCHRFCRRCTKRNYEVTPVSKFPLLCGQDGGGGPISDLE